MAKEAVVKLGKAEDNAKELIFNAMEQSRQIIKDAEIKGAIVQKEILQKANVEKALILKQANESAIKDCEPLIQEGAQNLSNINSPDSNKLEHTINLILERIVTVNGSC